MKDSFNQQVEEISTPIKHNLRKNKNITFQNILCTNTMGDIFTKFDDPTLSTTLPP